MRESSRVLRSGLLASLMVFIVASGALAYIGQARWSVTVTASAAVVPCGQDVKLTATKLVTATNLPVQGATVSWAITTSPSSADRLSTTSSQTDSDGKTTITLSFGATPGVRVVSATAGGVTGTTTVTCVAPGQDRVTVTASASVVRCDRVVKLTAIVRETSANSPVRGATVNWAITTSPSSADWLSNTTSQTNRKGKTTTRLGFGVTPGVRVVTATAGTANGFATVTCTAPPHHAHQGQGHFFVFGQHFFDLLFG